MACACHDGDYCDACGGHFVTIDRSYLCGECSLVLCNPCLANHECVDDLADGPRKPSFMVPPWFDDLGQKVVGMTNFRRAVQEESDAG